MSSTETDKSQRNQSQYLDVLVGKDVVGAEFAKGQRLQGPAADQPPKPKTIVAVTFPPPAQITLQSLGASQQLLLLLKIT